MHRLATVHARDNQPTTNDVTTQPISISACERKVRRLKIKQGLYVLKRVAETLLSISVTHSNKSVSKTQTGHTGGGGLRFRFLSINPK